VLIDAGRTWDRRRVFFRESDRVAICGDVIRNMSYATYLPGVKEPPGLFTYDPAENRRSIRKLAGLNLGAVDGMAAAPLRELTPQRCALG
jgi:hypothetical protein